VDTWENLARRFREYAGNDANKRNDKTLSEICAFMSTSSYGTTLKPSDADSHAVYILSDGETGVSHYFMPHADHATGLARFKKILSEIDWSARVKK
jgi:hypothetical protein